MPINDNELRALIEWGLPVSVALELEGTDLIATVDGERYTFISEMTIEEMALQLTNIVAARLREKNDRS
jgi:hypothetical protein